MDSFPDGFNEKWLEEQIRNTKMQEERMRTIRSEIYSKIHEAITHSRNGGKQSHINFKVLLNRGPKDRLLDDLLERFPTRIWYFDVSTHKSVNLRRLGDLPMDATDFQIQLPNE